MELSSSMGPISASAQRVLQPNRRFSNQSAQAGAIGLVAVIRERQAPPLTRRLLFQFPSPVPPLIGIVRRHYQVGLEAVYATHLIASFLRFFAQSSR